MTSTPPDAPATHCVLHSRVIFLRLSLEKRERAWCCETPPRTPQGGRGLVGSWQWDMMGMRHAYAGGNALLFLRPFFIPFFGEYVGSGNFTLTASQETNFWKRQDHQEGAVRRKGPSARVRRSHSHHASRSRWHDDSSSPASARAPTHVKTWPAWLSPPGRQP